MRAFLAVRLDAGLRHEVGALQDRLKAALAPAAARARVTWVRLETIHLTIKFLGDVPDEAVGRLREGVAAIVSGHLPLEIPFERVGAFPRPQAPRTIWIGPPEGWGATDTAGALVQLVGRLDAPCVAIGVPPESQAWRPHLTLARIRDGERAAGQALIAAGLFEQAWPLPPLRLDAISLMKSELRPDGPRHTQVWTVA